MRLFVTLGIATLLLAGSMARAQQDSLLTQRQAPLQLQQVSDAQMAPTDHRAVVDSWLHLEQQAQFFGYAVSNPGWSYIQILSPLTPDYVVLQFLRPHATSTGASAFTALIPRQGGKIWIVPVLYGGASPWKSASDMKYTREVFNRVIPAELAAQAIQPRGNWPQLALTFTSLAGDDVVALTVPSKDLRLSGAPVATYRVNASSPTRTLELSDVNHQGGFRIWDISFNPQGRVSRVHVTSHADTRLVAVSHQTPAPQDITSAPPPPGKTIHPTPIPH